MLIVIKRTPYHFSQNVAMFKIIVNLKLIATNGQIVILIQTTIWPKKKIYA